MSEFTVNHLDRMVDLEVKAEKRALNLPDCPLKTQWLDNIQKMFATLANAYDTADNDHYAVATAEAEWIGKGCGEPI